MARVTQEWYKVVFVGLPVCRGRCLPNFTQIGWYLEKFASLRLLCKGLARYFLRAGAAAACDQGVALSCVFRPSHVPRKVSAEFHAYWLVFEKVGFLETTM